MRPTKNRYLQGSFNATTSKDNNENPRKKIWFEITTTAVQYHQPNWLITLKNANTLKATSKLQSVHERNRFYKVYGERLGDVTKKT